MKSNGNTFIDSEFDRVHRLIKRADIGAIRKALDNGLDPNIRNRFEWTLLMLTALKGTTRIAELLIARGADMNAVNRFGESALSYAACSGHKKFVRALLTAGASREVSPHLHIHMTSYGRNEREVVPMLELIHGADATANIMDTWAHYKSRDEFEGTVISRELGGYTVALGPDKQSAFLQTDASLELGQCLPVKFVCLYNQRIYVSARLASAVGITLGIGGISGVGTTYWLIS